MIPLASPPMTKLAHASNAFGLDLYQRLRLKPGNLIFSPASLTMGVTMALGGARGETAAQMKHVLHLKGSQEDLITASGALARLLEDPARPLTLRLANQLFAEMTYELQQEFVEKTRASFGAPLELLDFKGAYEPARKGVFRTVHGGKKWNAVNGGLGSRTSVGSLVLDPSTPGRVWAGVDGGVFQRQW